MVPAYAVCLLSLCVAGTQAAGNFMVEDYWEYRLCLIFPTRILFAVQLYAHLLLVGICDEEIWARDQQPCRGGIIVSLIVFLIIPWQRPEALTYDILFHHPTQLPLQFVGGLAGSILSITLMMLICRAISGKWKDRLAKVGRYTLAIYGLQGVLLENVVENIWSIDETVCSPDVQQYVLAPVIGALTVFVCFCFAKAMEKNKITALLFLGKNFISQH